MKNLIFFLVSHLNSTMLKLLLEYFNCVALQIPKKKISLIWFCFTLIFGFIYLFFFCQLNAKNLRLWFLFELRLVVSFVVLLFYLLFVMWVLFVLVLKRKKKIMEKNVLFSFVIITNYLSSAAWSGNWRVMELFLVRA